MTIKLPVTADHNFIVDADQIPVAVAIQNPENGELDLSTAYARAADIVAALNATTHTTDWTPPEPPLSSDMSPSAWLAARETVWQRHRNMYGSGGPTTLDDALQYLRDETTLEHHFNSTGRQLWDALNMVERALRSKTPAPDLTAALKHIVALANEWEANGLGGVAVQRKRWQKLGEIARAALPKDTTP